MSIKTYLLAGTAVALFAGSALAADPLLLSDVELDHVTAGLDDIDADIDFDDFDFNNFQQLTFTQFGFQTTTTDNSVANALTGQISFALAGQAVTSLQGGFFSTESNGRVRIQNFDQWAEIDYD